MNYQPIIINIKENIDNLLNQYRSLFTRSEYIEIKKIYFQLEQKVFSSYEELKNFENKLRPYFAKVWQYELTPVDDFKLGEPFKFVIICPTRKIDDTIFSNYHFFSASLITDKHMGTFNKIPYGIICNVDENNFISASSTDSHTVYAESDSNISNQYFYTSTLSNGKKIYNKKYVSCTLLPRQIEMDLIKQNLKENKDFISQKIKTVYSDITLDVKNTNMLGVVLFDSATLEEKKEAEKLAHLFHLKIIVIPIQTYYNQLTISSRQTLKHIYNIENLDTIEYIIKNIDYLENEYSNLIFQHYLDLISIKSDDNLSKLVVHDHLSYVEIFKQNDSRYFKLDYSGQHLGIFHYYIDNIEIQRDEFQLQLMSNNKNLSI